MWRWDRRKRKMAAYAAMACIGAGCLIHMAPEQVRTTVEKTKDHLAGLFSAAAQELVLKQYSFLSYYMDGEGSIQDSMAEKIGQIVPLGSYVAEKAGKNRVEGTTEPESYPMMLPGETASDGSQSAESEEAKQGEEESASDETAPGESEAGQSSEAAAEETTQEMADGGEMADVQAASALIQPQPEILPQICSLPDLGGYTLEQMQDFQFLTEHLYVVDPSTSITEHELNPGLLLAKDLSVSKDSAGPQILIYHTHSQETFADSVQGEEGDTIVGVGDVLTEILTDTYGYQVLHHKGVYDMTDGVLDRDPAYEKSLPDLEQILSDNPSIEVVIDLHRDGVDEDVRLVTEIDGKPTARLMFFNGTCRDQSGERADLSNPYREDNLAFSLQMALAANAEYPDLMRVIYLKTNRYNQHLRSRSALVEVGAQTNTVEEAKNTMPILADLIDQVIRRGE